MRKIILNYFTLYYKVNLFSTKINFVRTANIIYPLFLITGYVGLFYMDYVIYPLILLILSILIGFVYVHFFPIIENIDYKLLTKSQKQQFDIYKNDKFNGKEIFDPLYVLFVNPILTILFLILFYYS